MKRIVVIGVGALGSHVILMGRNLKAQWVAIDFDRTEQKNILSQFHTRMGIGKNKAEALKVAMIGMFGTKLDVVPHRLTKDNVQALLGKADLVVDCLDNGDSRRIVQAFVREKGIPCLHGALAADGALGRIVWDEFFAVDDEGSAGAATCEDGVFLPFIGIVAPYLTFSIQQFVEKGRRLGFQVWPGGVTAL